MFKNLFLTLFILSFFPTFAHDNKIILLSEAMEPFIKDNSGKLSGPFIEAFLKIATENKIELEFQKVPIRRALKDIEKLNNHCVFAANYSPETSETLLYVSRLSEIKIWAYSLKQRNININNIKNLNKYKIGAVDIAEVRDILSLNSIQYTPIFRSASAMQMLLSNRFDILIGDINLELLNKQDTKKIKQNIPIITVEKWLICNHNLSQQIVKKLKTAYVYGLFAPNTKEIWKKYDMIKFYNANKPL